MPTHLEEKRRRISQFADCLRLMGLPLGKKPLDIPEKEDLLFRRRNQRSHVCPSQYLAFLGMTCLTPPRGSATSLV